MPKKNEPLYSCWSCGLLFANEMHAQRASISGCPRCDSYQVGPHKDNPMSPDEIREAERDFSPLNDE